MNRKMSNQKLRIRKSRNFLKAVKICFFLGIIILSISIIIFPVKTKAQLEDIIWDPAHDNNYRESDRENTYNITYIVLHVGEGPYDAIKWTFKDPNAYASAHYVISKEGEITQMVRDKDIAFHAGNWEYNKHSIGIEHEGFSDDPDSFTEAMYRASVTLVRELAKKYNIQLRHPSGVAPVDAETSSGIIGHDQVPDPDDPSKGGGSDWHYDPGQY